MRKIKKAVIMAAGFGSRFLPVVKAVPKEMLPIIDRPILQHVVEDCIEADFEEIIIVVRKGNEVVRNYFFEQVPLVKQLLSEQGKPERYLEVERVLNMRGITIIDQDPALPYGNGSPVLSAKHLLKGEEAFGVLFADDLVLTNGNPSAMKQLVTMYEGSDAEGITAVQRVSKAETNRYGIVKPKGKDASTDEGQIDYIIEKPDPDKTPSLLASYGRFILPYRIFDYLTPEATGKDEEIWLQDANDQIAKTGKYMYKVVDGEWFTTGDPFRHYQALTKFMLDDARYGKDTKEFLKSVK